MNFSVTMIEQYNISGEIINGTESFTKDEIQQAKRIILEELAREGLEKYRYRLILVDNKNERKIIVIHAFPDEQHEFDGKESRGRTYYIQDGRVVRVIKAKPKQSAP